MSKRKEVEEQIRRRAIGFHGPWLGAIFETGGSMGLTIRSDKKLGEGITSVNPFMHIREQEAGFNLLLQDMYGGSAYPKGDPKQWYLSNAPSILLLAHLMEPFAPSRANSVIKALDTWQATQDLAQRIVIAQGITEWLRDDLTKYDYSKIAEDPEFTSGLIDRKLHPYHHDHEVKGKRYQEPVADIISVNKPLLEAVGRRYDLTPIPIQVAGTEIAFAEREFTTQRDSFILHFHGAKTVQLLEETFHYLLYKQDAAKKILERS